MDPDTQPDDPLPDDEPEDECDNGSLDGDPNHGNSGPGGPL